MDTMAGFGAVGGLLFIFWGIALLVMPFLIWGVHNQTTKAARLLVKTNRELAAIKELLEKKGSGIETTQTK